MSTFDACTSLMMRVSAVAALSRTRIVRRALAPSGSREVAVMEASPDFSAVTTPFPSTVATVSLLDDQIRFWKVALAG